MGDVPRRILDPDSPALPEDNHTQATELGHPRYLQNNRPSHLDIFVTGNSEPVNAPPTPPYRLDASPSQVALGHAFPPDYRSEMNVSREHMHSTDDLHHHDSEKSSYPREKQSSSSGDRSTAASRNHSDDLDTGPGGIATAKGVHYQDSLTPKPGRTFTGIPGRPYPPSRMSSIADSDMDDDEGEMYDWSDEEDLVDEEAKYGHKMGKKTDQKKGFSFGRYNRKSSTIPAFSN